MTNMSKEKIILSAFEMNCSGHQSPGLWRHPEDESINYKKPSYWRNLAKLLEKGKFDFIFLADVLGTYDVYEGSRNAAVKSGVQVPVNDPAFIIPIMSEATKHLGFGLTSSVSYDHPYSFARKISTLDHLTEGRIGWNVVTSYLESAARNLGLKKLTSHDERYNLADEYMEVVYKLWEKSWEEDAVVLNKEQNIFAEPAKVHDIHHYGEYFEVPGAHLCEPSPQRSPVIFQAGASPRGRKFAGTHAELVFIASTSIEKTKATVDAIRVDTEKCGRRKEDVKIITMMTPIVAETNEKAQEKFEAYKQYASKDGALTLMGGWTGIDLSQFDEKEVIGNAKSNAIQTTLKAFSNFTVDEIAEFVGVGGFGPVLVGNPVEIADSLEEWIEITGVDGFNIAYAVTPGTFEDFIELVIPILQERGLVKREYEDGTLRYKLFGQDELKSNHRGKNVSIKEEVFS